MSLLRLSRHASLSLAYQSINCNCYSATITGEMPPGSKEVKTIVSSLRIDNIASAGLNISRRSMSIFKRGFQCAFNRVMWERFMDGQVMYNGKVAEKKSAIVKEGDVIDVDSPLVDPNKGKGDPEPSSNDASIHGKLFKRGRVIVKEIGEQTTKNSRWHVTLLRHKQFDTVRTLAAMK